MGVKFHFSGIFFLSILCDHPHLNIEKNGGTGSTLAPIIFRKTVIIPLEQCKLAKKGNIFLLNNYLLEKFLWNFFKKLTQSFSKISIHEYIF